MKKVRGCTALWYTLRLSLQRISDDVLDRGAFSSPLNERCSRTSLRVSAASRHSSNKLGSALDLHENCHHAKQN